MMLADQFLLVLAAGCLAAFAMRLAERIAGGDDGGGDRSLLEVVLVAAPIAVGFAVAWTLLLGRTGLSGSPVALAAGPVAAAIAARVGLGPGSLTTLAWGRTCALRGGERVLAGLLAGILAGAVLGIARCPGFGFDALNYHLPEALGWIHSGHAGSVQYLDNDYPVGDYPVTAEVLLSWFLGISRSFAPVTLYSPLAAALLLAGLWRLLRLLRVAPAVAGLSLAAIATLPMLLFAIDYFGPGTDLLPVGWLACAAALAPRCSSRPALLGPILLAAGLGVGTKTTVAPLCVVVVGWGAWTARARLSSAWRSIGLGLLAGLVVGAPWYVRDWITHGWPLWPLSTGPGGDPVPRTIAETDVSFISRPLATFRATPRSDLEFPAGAFALVTMAVLAPLIARSRAVIVAGLVASLSVLAWLLAPYTGLSRDPAFGGLAQFQIRYLLSAFVACTVAAALVHRDGSAAARRVVVAGLGVAVVGSLVCDGLLGYPIVPKFQYPLVGALGGLAVGAAWAWGSAVGRGGRVGPVELVSDVRGQRQRIAASWLGALLVAGLVAGALSVIGRDFLYHEAVDGVNATYSQALTAALSEPSFRTGDQPMAIAPFLVAGLAGSRLQHALYLIPPRESCARTRARLRREWVLLMLSPLTARDDGYNALTCLQDETPVYASALVHLYAPETS